MYLVVHVLHCSNGTVLISMYVPISYIKKLISIENSIYRPAHEILVLTVKPVLSGHSKIDKTKD